MQNQFLKIFFRILLRIPEILSNERRSSLGIELNTNLTLSPGETSSWNRDNVSRESELSIERGRRRRRENGDDRKNRRFDRREVRIGESWTMFLWRRKWLKKVGSRDQSFYTELLCKTFRSRWSLLSRRALERVCSGRTEGELKDRGDDFSNEFHELLGKSEVKFTSREIFRTRYFWWRAKFWKFNIYSVLIKQFRNDIL